MRNGLFVGARAKKGSQSSAALDKKAQGFGLEGASTPFPDPAGGRDNSTETKTSGSKIGRWKSGRSRSPDPGLMGRSHAQVTFLKNLPFLIVNEAKAGARKITANEQRLVDFCAVTPEEAQTRLKSGPAGLTADAVERAREEFGSNELKASEKHGS